MWKIVTVPCNKSTFWRFNGYDGLHNGAGWLWWSDGVINVARDIEINNNNNNDNNFNIYPQMNSKNEQMGKRNTRNNDNNNRTNRRDDWITLAKVKIINYGDKLGQSISFIRQNRLLHNKCTRTTFNHFNAKCWNNETLNRHKHTFPSYRWKKKRLNGIKNGGGKKPTHTYTHTRNRWPTIFGWNWNEEKFY